MPEKSHGWRSLLGYSSWGCTESDMTEQLHVARSKNSGGSIHVTPAAACSPPHPQAGRLPVCSHLSSPHPLWTLISRSAPPSVCVCVSICPPSIPHPSIHSSSIHPPSIPHPLIHPSATHLSIHSLTIHPPFIIHPSSIHPSSIDPSIYHPSIHTFSIDPSSIHHPSILHLSLIHIHPSATHLSIHSLLIHPPFIIHPSSILHPPIHPSIHPSSPIHLLSIHLSIHPCFHFSPLSSFPPSLLLTESVLCVGLGSLCMRMLMILGQVPV